MEITVSILPVVFAAVVFGPLSAMAVGALGLVVTFGQPYVRWMIWTSTRALGAGLAGVAASLLLLDNPTAGRLFAAVAIAAFVDATVDALLGAVVVAIRRSGDSLRGLRLLRPILLGTVPLYTPIIVLLIYAYQEFSTWSLLLFLVPAFAAHRLHGLYREQRQTTDQLRVANERLERANLSFATALVAASGRTGPVHRRPFSSSCGLCEGYCDSSRTLRGKAATGPSLWPGSRHRESRSTCRPT